MEVIVLLLFKFDANMQGYVINPVGACTINTEKKDWGVINVVVRCNVSIKPLSVNNLMFIHIREKSWTFHGDECSVITLAVGRLVEKPLNLLSVYQLYVFPFLF